ncbi:MAG TPA: dihydrodipicolinate synthase family protein [Steroidobacteraceae bacterium]|nr:dihydrodipicolinate synthase family protein [Steroidobacteraceae bacterium]
MSESLSCSWSGVFPAATTQFDPALQVDLRATQRVQAALIQDGVHGLVLMGTVGEGNSLSAEEKRSVLKAAVEVSAGKAPVIVGVSEFTTAAAAKFARDAEELGASGLMVLPAMVYVPKPAELEYHFRTVAAATGLPIMLYNNPPSYRVNIDIATLRCLADVPNIVALKESAPDSRRFTDLINEFGERFVLFAGLDDVAFEGLVLGAKGWVSGLTNAFPAESLELYEALRNGDLTRARTLYRWFMPLLHLDAEHDLVQTIKLAEQVMGRGSERVRPPRLPLAGERRAQVIAMIERARDTRPANDAHPANDARPVGATRPSGDMRPAGARRP